jgi:hypothetical protein
VNRTASSSILPPTDPTPIFELFRGNYGTELLVAAVAHFNIFDRLERDSMNEAELRKTLGLQFLGRFRLAYRSSGWQYLSNLIFN